MKVSIFTPGYSAGQVKSIMNVTSITVISNSGDEWNIDIIYPPDPAKSYNTTFTPGVVFMDKSAAGEFKVCKSNEKFTT